MKPGLKSTEPIIMLITLTASIALAVSTRAQECAPGQGLMSTTTAVVTPSGSCTCNVTTVRLMSSASPTSSSSIESWVRFDLAAI